MQRDGEVAHFAWRGDRGSAVEIARGDRPRDVAQLHHRSRHASRKQVREEQNADDRNQAGDENVASRARNDVAQRRRADRDADEAERMANGDVELVVSSGRAAPMTYSEAARSRRDDLGTR